jgi:hypothetical protein
MSSVSVTGYTQSHKVKVKAEGRLGLDKDIELGIGVELG